MIPYCTLSEPSFVSMRTCEVPSVIHTLAFPVTRLPAILNNTTLYTALSRLDSNERREISNEALDFLRECWSLLYPIRSTDVRRLLTLDECVNGVTLTLSPLVGVPSLNMATSAGYPYNKLSPIGKHNFFTASGTEPPYYIPIPGLVAEFDSFCTLLESGIMTHQFMQFSLKDELRPVEKVLAGKTRIIENAPLVLQLALRRYLGAYTARIHSDYLTAPASCGINATSMDWELLWDRFHGFSHRLGFDIERFDFSQLIQLHFHFATCANDWYSPSPPAHDTARLTLIKYLAYFLGVLGSLCFIITGVHPSGGGITTDNNSFQTACYILWTIHSLMVEQGLSATPSETIDAIAFAVYGDDNILAHNFSWLTREAFVAKVKEIFSVSFTDARNDVYLKRGVLRRVECGVSLTFAPLDKSIIEDMTNWCSTGLNMELTFISTLTSATDEALQWGEEYYNMFTARTAAACLSVGFPYTYLPYKIAIRKLVDAHYR